MLDFFYFPQISSTQKWLVENIRKQNIASPSCVMSDMQTNGIGSRNNGWENVESALMFSFCFDEDLLPSDLPRQSISIYLGFLLKEWLRLQGYCNIWLKWPNDLYLNNSKLGGILTQSVQNQIVCGVGINLKARGDYAFLGENWNQEEKQAKIEHFLEFFFKFPTWSYIFQNYKLEFHKNLNFTFHVGNRKVYFRDVCLCEDGSLLWENQKIYSLR